LSLKNNIDMVREELNSEEKFFEKAVMTERFVKKYKNVMIGSLIAIVVAVVANIAYDANEHSKITAANEALSELNLNAANPKALSDLKESSPNLYDVWTFSQTIANKDVAKLKELSSSKALLVADLAAYELANDAKSLNDYALKQNSIYRDLASVQSAIMLMNESKIDGAHEKLLKISEDSSLYKIAQALLHYGVK
jgi:hypothetical protein